MTPKLPTSLALVAALLVLAATLVWAMGWLNVPPAYAQMNHTIGSAVSTPVAATAPVPAPTPAAATITTVVASQPHQEPVVQAVGKTLPSVVNIHTERVVERYLTTPYHAYFGKYYKQSEKIKSLGSGMLVSADGYIVTNHHVVEMAEKMKISVTLFNDDKHKYEARFIRSEPSLDLALIKVDLGQDMPHFDLSRLSPNLLGQTVIALGNPVGYSSSVSRGILSAKNREFEGDGVRMTGLLQTDAAINPGNSGGPLVDIEGKLVGLNTAKFASVSVEGIGFAVPGSVVAEWVKDAIAVANGQKPDQQPAQILALMRQRLGLTVDDVGDRLVRVYGNRPVAGLFVEQVSPNSAAAKAGLKPGMLITEISGERVLNTAHLPRSLLRLKPGQELDLVLVEYRMRGSSIMQRRVGARLRSK